MEHIKRFLSSRIWRERILPCATFFAILYEFTFAFARPMMPDALVLIFLAVRPAAFVCEGILLLGVVLSRERWRSFLLLNVCWLLLTRCFLGDLGASAQSSVRWAILFVCFFHCFTFLSKKQKDLLFGLVTLELTFLLSLWAVLGIATAITGHTTAGVKGISFSAEGAEPALVFISFFRIHRNLSATYFVCAAGMLLYHCRKTNAPFWKGLTILFLPLAVCAIAIQHSRSNYLAFAVLLGLMLVNSFTQLRKWPRGRAGNAAAVCALVLSVALIFIGMGAVSDGISILSRGMRKMPLVESASAETMSAEIQSAEISADGEIEAENEAPTELFDSRDTLADSWTLTERTDIWKAGLLTIREGPSIALIGLPAENVMTRVEEITDRKLRHMHNTLMQQLMTSGVPGMVIYCLFFLSLLKKIALDVRHRWKKKGLMQPLEALLLALLVYGVFEPLLCESVRVSSLVFCLSAGLLCTGLRDP